MKHSNDELIARWRGEPAPLLPLLHALHDRDGYLSDDALRAVAKGLRLPIADLFGTVTFYHHFSRQPPGKAAPRVCDGPVCKHRGTQALLQGLPGATVMPCAGRCDGPVPVLQGDLVRVGSTPDGLAEEPSPLPPPYPGDRGECVFAEIRTHDRATLAGYRSTGGYRALTAARDTMTPNEIIDVITASGLAGRGGAGFPTGRKWKAVAQAPGGPKTIVCNADEGEPGCFKDRALMDHDPHALVEGMAIVALATGATRGFIYLRYEYPQTLVILEDAIAEAQRVGLLDGFDLYVRRGAGAYVCGEETSLLNSLEGKHPFPRNRPPYPVTHGFEDRPTVVNNVETLCAVAPILRHGAAWYRDLGLGDHAGTKVISLSGDVQRPGNYEIPIGLPLRTLLHEWAGGPAPGRTIQAVTMAGLSGGLLGPDALQGTPAVTLDEPCLRARGAFLGAGGIMVFDDTRHMVELAHEAMEFFAHESCGKCFPCRIGTQRLTERLSGGGPVTLDAWTAEVTDIGDAMKATSACGLGTAAPLITDSLLRYFPDQVARHLAGRKA
ncbi:MAG: NAD(P)H-dependent oxidoreductase subunit E [Myxococcales bacterium]|nr:NAD(P)H-dependent oxidoreductase subunit E [Myxococcales bacterium]